MKVFTGMTSKKGPSKNNEETDQNNNTISLLYNVGAAQIESSLPSNTSSDSRDCADTVTMQKESASAGPKESQAATPISQQCDRLTGEDASCGSDRSHSTSNSSATEVKECLHKVLGNFEVQTIIVTQDDDDDGLGVDDKFESSSSICSGHRSRFQSTESLFADSGFNSSTCGDDKDDSLSAVLELRNIPHHGHDSDCDDDINCGLEDNLSELVSGSSCRKSSSDSGISTSSDKDSDVALSESDGASSQSDADITSWTTFEAVSETVHPDIVRRHRSTGLANVNSISLDSRGSSRRNYGRRRRAVSGTATTDNDSNSDIPERPVLVGTQRRLMVKDTNNNLAAGRKIRSFLPSFKSRLVDGFNNNGILGLIACIVYGLFLVFACTAFGIVFEAGKSFIPRDLHDLRNNVINNGQQRRTGTSLG